MMADLFEAFAKWIFNIITRRILEIAGEKSYRALVRRLGLVTADHIVAISIWAVIFYSLHFGLGWLTATIPAIITASFMHLVNINIWRFIPAIPSSNFRLLEDGSVELSGVSRLRRVMHDVLSVVCPIGSFLVFAWVTVLLGGVGPGIAFEGVIGFFLYILVLGVVLLTLLGVVFAPLILIPLTHLLKIRLEVLDFIITAISISFSLAVLNFNLFGLKDVAQETFVYINLIIKDWWGFRSVGPMFTTIWKL